MKRVFIAAGLFLAVLFVSAWAETLENKISVSVHGYGDDADEEIFSGKIDVFRIFRERLGFGVSLGIDAISGATKTASADAVSGATVVAAPGDDDDEGGDGDDDGSDYNARVYPSFRLVYDDGDNNVMGGAYFSFEDDYTGRAVFLNYTRQLNLQNTSLSAGITQSFDKWDVGGLDDDDRKERQVSLSVTQLLGRRTQIQAGYDLLHSEGHLGNPNRYIDFAVGGRVLERLPSDRDGYALSARLVQLLAEPTSVHLSYRYYDDDWGINSHTTNVALFQDLSETFTLGGRYRYYTQGAADFIKPVGQYAATDPLIGIDYKYTDFDAHTVGLMAIYKPGSGLESPGGGSGWGNTTITFSVDAYQTSSNDYIRAWYGQSRLTAYFASLGLEYKY